MSNATAEKRPRHLDIIDETEHLANFAAPEEHLPPDPREALLVLLRQWYGSSRPSFRHLERWLRTTLTGEQCWLILDA